MFKLLHFSLTTTYSHIVVAPAACWPWPSSWRVQVCGWHGCPNDFVCYPPLLGGRWGSVCLWPTCAIVWRAGLWASFLISTIWHSRKQVCFPPPWLHCLILCVLGIKQLWPPSQVASQDEHRTAIYSAPDWYKNTTTNQVSLCPLPGESKGFFKDWLRDMSREERVRIWEIGARADKGWGEGKRENMRILISNW